MDMANPWEQVVLDLKVESANEPAQQSAVAGKIYRRFDLVCCPGVFHASGARLG
jgi:hypothetical protein